MKSIIATFFVTFYCYKCTICFPLLIPNSILEDDIDIQSIGNDTSIQPQVSSMNDAVEFMKKFGYLENGDSTVGSLLSEEGLQQRLKLVQKFGALPQTGELDEATIKLMNSPRCGVEDVDRPNPRRRKRFVVGSKGWNKRRLTYYVANWSGKLLSKEHVQSELKKAFAEWAKYSYLEFTEINSNQADIVIFFATYNHQDGYPFDGMGGTLAHAYYPYEFDNYGGDIHFDDSEDWKIKPKDEYSGLEFFSVAVHEIGHSLGLAHSPVQSSIMFPYYKGHQQTTFALGYDDIMGMWQLYIQRRLAGDDEYFNTTTQHPSTTPTKDGFQNDEPITTPKSSCPDQGCDSKDIPETSTDDIINYHGDSKTVDEHEKQFGGKKPILPALPPLQPDEEDIRRKYYEDEKRRREEEMKKEEDRRKQEEKTRREDRTRQEERVRQEEKVRQEEEKNRRAEERRLYEEEIRRYEEEVKRRDEDRKRYEEEIKKREEERRTSKSSTSYTSTTTRDGLTPPNICQGGINSIAKIRGEIIIFKGKYAWRYYRKMNPVPGSPVSISSLFEGLPTMLQKVDAAYERRNDSNIVFFIGKHYYVHNGRNLLINARPITDYGVPETVPKIDAIFSWSKNNRTYLFSQNLYWRRDDTVDKMDDNYPKSISNWNGIPSNLDAAITDEDGITHFLNGGYTWSYDNNLVAPDRYSPRRISDVWTGC